MCEFCIQHGEGKKWYLQAKNYSQELVNEERKQFMTRFWEGFEDVVVKDMSEMDRLIATNSPQTEAVRKSLVTKYKKEHYGQVVPLEEVEQIFDMSLAIVRVPCVCRSALKGRSDARYCFGVVTFRSDSAPILSYPDWTGDLEMLTVEEGKKALRKHDRNGLVHSVWTFITPYIGGVCNCTTNDCLALKSRTRLGFQVLFKAEYVAAIDWEACKGCRDCMKLCNFGAISFSPSLHKCYVNQLQCYGCGVCRAVCTNEAISLRDRNLIPVLSREW